MCKSDEDEGNYRREMFAGTLNGPLYFLFDHSLKRGRGRLRFVGQRGAGVSVRILELSSTSSQYSDPVITSHLMYIGGMESRGYRVPVDSSRCHRG